MLAWSFETAMAWSEYVDRLQRWLPDGFERRPDDAPQSSKALPTGVHFEVEELHVSSPGSTEIAFFNRWCLRAATVVAALLVAG